MVTALTVNGGSTASSTLSSAAAMFNATGGTGTTNNSVIGTATGYGQNYGLGNAGAWAASGSIGSPDGNGWLFDSTVLEGQTIVAGNWSGTMKMRTGTLNQTVVGDLYWRAYKRSSGGVYTAIGTLSLTGQSITDVSSALVTFSFGPSSFSSMAFSTGDKLYMDSWFNCTTNGQGNSTLRILVQESVSTTQGFAGVCELVTPGYQTTGGGGATHLLICDGFGGVFS
jgi:hypothetical protein